MQTSWEDKCIINSAEGGNQGVVQTDMIKLCYKHVQTCKKMKLINLYS